MATKKSSARDVPAHENTDEKPRNRQDDIAERVKAKEEAVTQEGVEKTPAADVNEEPSNTESGT